LFTVISQACIPMPFSQPPTIGTDHQRNVTIPGNLVRQLQGPMQQDLARGGIQKIVAADHMRHPGSRVIQHDRELIRRHAVRFEDNEIAKLTNFPRHVPG